MQEQQDLQQKLIKRYQAMEIIERFAQKEPTDKDLSKIIGSNWGIPDKSKELFSRLEEMYGTEIAQDKKNILLHLCAEKAMELSRHLFWNKRGDWFGFGGFGIFVQGLIDVRFNLFEIIRSMRSIKEKKRIVIEVYKKIHSMVLYVLGRIALDFLETPDTEITEPIFRNLFNIYEHSWDNRQVIQEMLNTMQANAGCVDAIVQKMETLYGAKLNEAAQPSIDAIKMELQKNPQSKLIGVIKDLVNRIGKKGQEWNTVILTALCAVLGFHLETKQQADAGTLKCILEEYAIPQYAEQ